MMLDFTNLYKKRTELFEYVMSNDYKSLQNLLKNCNQKQKTNNINEEATTPVAFTGNSDYINLNFLDRDKGQTPLHAACQIGNLQMVKLLVEFGSSQNIKNKDGWYPIHLATYFGHFDIVMFLIDEKNFDKESVINVFDDEDEKHQIQNIYQRNFNNSQLPIKLSNSNVYRSSSQLGNAIENDDEQEEDSDVTSNSSCDEEDDDYENKEVDVNKSSDDLNDLLVDVSNTLDTSSSCCFHESFYLANLNLDELKFLDLNADDLFDVNHGSKTLSSLTTVEITD